MPGVAKFKFFSFLNLIIIQMHSPCLIKSRHLLVLSENHIMNDMKKIEHQQCTNIQTVYNATIKYVGQTSKHQLAYKLLDS